MDAGFEFKYSLEEMLDDTIQCCKENGYLWMEKKEAKWYLLLTMKMSNDQL
jgi:hypothetical protein